MEKSEILSKIRALKTKLDEMRQYKIVMAEDGIKPDRADKERESDLIVRLIRLEKLLAEKEGRPYVPGTNKPGAESREADKPRGFKPRSNKPRSDKPRSDKPRSAGARKPKAPAAGSRGGKKPPPRKSKPRA